MTEELTTYPDPERAALERRRELAEAADATQRRAKATTETARQEAWTIERPALALRHAEWHRHCEDTQTPYIDNGPLPMMAPAWFRTDTGEPVEHEAHVPSMAPAAAMSETHDVLGRPYPVEPLETPESVFARAAKAEGKRGLLRRK